VLANCISLLREIKGDMCRLGYSKILCHIANEFQPYSKEVLANTLQHIVTTNDNDPIGWAYPERLSTTALIPKARAINYLEFATKIEILSANNFTLGSKGRILRRVLRASQQSGVSEIREAISSTNPLILETYEKIFFFVTLSTFDGLVLIPLMNYMCNKKRAARQEVMFHLMEDIYPEALTQYAKSFGPEKRYKLENEIRRAESFKSERLRIKAEEWPNSKLYALYRHVGNPRIEWLVDVGFLEKSGSDFTPSMIASQIVQVMHTVQSPNELFNELGKLMITNAHGVPDEKIISAIIRCYNDFSRAGYLSVNIEVLTPVVLLDGLRENIVEEYAKVKGMIQSLPEKYPKSARFHADRTGKPNFIKIDVKDLINGA
jgi:hypothetical protein